MNAGGPLCLADPEASCRSLSRSRPQHPGWQAIAELRVLGETGLTAKCRRVRQTHDMEGSTWALCCSPEGHPHNLREAACCLRVQI
jgi:hypothetical protein